MGRSITRSNLAVAFVFDTLGCNGCKEMLGSGNSSADNDCEYLYQCLAVCLATAQQVRKGRIV